MNLPKISDNLGSIKVGRKGIKYYTVQCIVASYLFPFWCCMHELPLFDESLRKMGSDKPPLFQQLCTMTASIEKHIIGSKMPHFFHLHWIRHETPSGKWHYVIIKACWHYGGCALNSILSSLLISNWSHSTLKRENGLLHIDSIASDEILHPLKSHLQIGFITTHNWLGSMWEHTCSH